MKIISPANATVLNLLRPFQKFNQTDRWLRYCIITPVEDTYLIFNLMTREMIQLTDEEYNNYLTNPYLLTHWFTVPNTINEKEFIDIIKMFIKKQQKNFEEITNYSVFTTTDCNARCFYCYESGCSKLPMSLETCEKIVKYIKTHCGGKSVRINWFGGEPLLNTDAIDYICDRLEEEGVTYRSKMISNGYLLDDTNVQKAATKWNLQEIQITLDGTEDVYNRVKDYIYTKGNPYRIVLSNIQRLLDAGIPTSVRLNVDLYNSDDILALVDELAGLFGRGQKLYVYVHRLFQDLDACYDEAAENECALVDAAIRKVEKKLTETGLKPSQGIPKIYKSYYCMADCGNAITFLPTGHIGLCEIYTDSEFIGHLDQDGFDQAVVSSWREPTPEISACSECFYFPECSSIKKCKSRPLCYPAYQKSKLLQIKDQMLFEYQQYLQNNS